MATKRRFARHAGKKKKAPPPWVFAIGGLAAGVIIAWGAYAFFLNKGSTTKTAPAVAQAQPATKRTPPPKAEKQAAPAKPRYDFYTILSRNETVLPERSTRKAPPTPTKADAAHYVLQAGSFGDYDDADRLKAKLALSGLEAHIEKIAIDGKGDFFRVRLGPYKNLGDLDNYDKRLAELGVKALRIQIKSPSAAAN